MLLLNFKESFFTFLNLGEKVADFSERSSRRLSVLLESTATHTITKMHMSAEWMKITTPEFKSCIKLYCLKLCSVTYSVSWFFVCMYHSHRHFKYNSFGEISKSKLNLWGVTHNSSLWKQPSFFAPGPSGVSQEGRLRFTAENSILMTYVWTL